jgi:DNA-binding transcriptional regulator YhcF (GntR family)
MLEGEGFLTIRDRAGVTVSAPSPEISEVLRGELVGDLRAILARLRQAGMDSQELLGVVREEVEALDSAAEGERR